MHTKQGRQSRGSKGDVDIAPSCQQKERDLNWTKYEIIDLVEAKKLEFLNDLDKRPMGSYVARCFKVGANFTQDPSYWIWALHMGCCEVF